MSSEPLIFQARELLKKGDFVGVYDVAYKSLEDGEIADPTLAHLAVLSLARSGATTQAEHLYRKVKALLPPTEENLSLEARLYKDQFLKATDPATKTSLGKKARDLYLAAYRINKNYYPGINAATLSLIIGDKKSCHRLAREVLKLCNQNSVVYSGEDYYVEVTRAEANLLLGNEDQIAPILSHACRSNAPDYGKLSTTWKQLSLICEYRGIATDCIEAIRPPTVVAFMGQTIHGMGKSPGIDPADEPMLREQIRNLLEQYNIKIAFGSLACGADLMVAEEILNQNGELNVILPFSREEFKRTSVSPAGPAWEAKFDRALKRAASVYQIVEDAYTGYDLLYEACSLQIMGLASLRSQTLGSQAYQIAVWNGQPSASPGGTAAAMQRWEGLGQKNLIIQVPEPRSKGVAPLPVSASQKIELKRHMKAMIFADVKGYSSLKEKQLPQFVAKWFQHLEQIFNDHSGEILFANTWGDAIYLVIDSVSSAARVSLELTRIFSEEDLAELELPEDLGLRVAAHVGPIFEGYNPLTRKKEYFGTHVNKTARMEPCTPVGSVYVTEPFAALLSMEAAGAYRCEYVGNHPLPKNFGRIRMYHLGEQ
ncbi:MAG: TRAFs-binding domain-containing protein [Nitrospinota bacterium]|nr:TRAFs-binding domain-containing protein [Nitrospinota bacterium]